MYHLNPYNQHLLTDVNMYLVVDVPWMVGTLEQQSNLTGDIASPRARSAGLLHPLYTLASQGLTRTVARMAD
ncbi:hypothetical protein CI610_03724 [invertebrate metagenome]|uniref:Uncharacterized protein n=1 Tax=invertebrate metagenome TaxID=1711999 RepID=A0A2H9T2B9_9ZZZZ